MLASLCVKGWEQEMICTRRWTSLEQRLLTDWDLSKRDIRIPWGKSYSRVHTISKFTQKPW